MVVYLLCILTISTNAEHLSDFTTIRSIARPIATFHLMLDAATLDVALDAERPRQPQQDDRQLPC